MRGQAVTLLVAALLVLLAGCLGQGPAEPESPAEEGEDDAPEQAEIRRWTIDGCTFTCFEPSVDVGPDGVVYVAESAGKIWRIANGSVEALGTVPLPDDVPEGYIREDGLVDIREDGRLYYSAMLTDPSVPTGYSVPGIQVAASDDGGASWSPNTYISRESQEPSLGTEVDRQWLGFGDGSTVYLIYDQQPSNTACSGTWMARSDDGGASFDQPRRAAPGFPVGGCNPSGPPVGLGGEQAVFPHWTPQANGAASLTAIETEDGGETFASHDAPATDGDWFPVLDASQAGVHLVYHDSENRTRSTTAPDLGQPWTEPRTWTRGNVSITSPWLDARKQQAALAWITQQNAGDDVATLHVQHANATANGLEPAGPVHDVGTIEPNSHQPANTDFADVALAPDGATWTVWNPGDESIGVARVPS